MVTGHKRGHAIQYTNGCWVYTDNGVPIDSEEGHALDAVECQRQRDMMLALDIYPVLHLRAVGIG